MNEKRSGDKKAAGIPLNYYNQLPLILEKQKEFLNSIKSSNLTIEDRDEGAFDDHSPTKSA